MKIPQGHQQIMPYFLVNDAQGLIDFLAKVFDAKETVRKHRDSTTIMHAEMEIGDQTVMLADSTPDWKEQTVSLFIYVDDADKTFQKALNQGATSLMSPSDENYGRSGGIKDPFGNIWWITSVN